MSTSNKPKLLPLSISVLLAACSSGGAEQQPGGTATYSLRGSVPGTLIEAFCEDGRYFSTHSDRSTRRSRHPFELDLPIGLSCRLVMTTGEDTPEALVTPIGFNKLRNSSIAFEGYGDIDIGYVALVLGSDPGCAQVPATPVYDLDCNGIQDTPVYVEIDSYDFEVITRVSDPLDDDRDYLIDAYEDDDGDGVPNCKDDNSGTDDHDGDGIENAYDVDDDNDGINDDEDEDDDDHSDDEDSDDDDDEADDEDDEGDEDDEDDEDRKSAPSFTNDEPSAGRLLVATQCAQCHGTDGFSLTDIDSIAGEERSELLEETTEDADEPGNLMGFHGSAYLGLTPELEAIADYLSKQ